MNECYIVVRLVGGALIAPTTGGADVVYIPHRPVSLLPFMREGGHEQIVFLTLKDALWFLSDVGWVGHEGELWECSCDKVRRGCPKPSGPHAQMVRALYLKGPWSAGIGFTDQVTLTRKVGISKRPIYIPVTLRGTKWEGKGKNHGLVFDLPEKTLKHYGQLVYGYQELSRRERNHLMVWGYGVLYRSSGGITLAEGELAAWSIYLVNFIKGLEIEKPRARCSTT